MVEKKIKSIWENKTKVELSEAEISHLMQLLEREMIDSKDILTIEVRYPLYLQLKKILQTLEANRTKQIKEYRKNRVRKGVMKTL